MSALVCQAPDCYVPLPENKGGKGPPRIWCSEACRKRTQYGGTCKGCGAKTNGSNGPGTAPDYCRKCRPARRWTRELVIRAILNWNLNHGEPPRSTQWIKKIPGVDHPVTTTVVYVFGTWNAGIVAAGFPSRKPGEYERVKITSPARRPRKSKPVPQRAPSPPKPKSAPTIPRNDARRRRGVPTQATIRRSLVDPEIEDHSTNTPAKNRALVAKVRGGY